MSKQASSNGSPPSSELHGCLGHLQISGHIGQIRRRGEAASYRALGSDMEHAVRAREDAQLSEEVEPQNDGDAAGPGSWGKPDPVVEGVHAAQAGESDSRSRGTDIEGLDNAP